MNAKLEAEMVRVAETLEQIAKMIRGGLAGDKMDLVCSRCFFWEWCGMQVIGTVRVHEDVAEWLDDARIAFEEVQKNDIEDAEHCCKSERA